MLQVVIKVIVSALIIVAVSEVSKRTTTIGALLASLPLTSLLAMITRPAALASSGTAKSV